MESVYDPENVHATKPLNLKAYFQEFGELFSSKLYSSNKEHLISVLKEELPLQDDNELEENIASWQEMCSIDKLNIVGEISDLPTKIPEKLTTKMELAIAQPITEKARTLDTVTCMERNEEKALCDINLGTKKLIRQTQNRTLHQMDLNMKCAIDISSNIIYSIIIYRPFVLNFVQRNSSENLRFAFQMEALGTNTLLQLANKIYCLSDLAIIKEVQDTNVDLSAFTNANCQYPSRFFFVGDTFYNDFENHASIDLSYGIRQWMKDKNIANCKSADMALTRMDSLQPRLGYPYVYVHQGKCEHVFTFSDVRIVPSAQCLNYSKYPKTVFTKSEKNLICFMCTVIPAKWMVLNSDRLPHKKVFMCKECCDSYMYLNGEKIGNFQLFPFFDSDLLLGER